MDRNSIVLGMAATFAGCAVVLTIAALAVRQPLVLLVAVPFAASAYFFWYQATGRLAARVHRRDARARARSTATRTTSDPGFGGGPRATWRPPGGRGRQSGSGGGRTTGGRRPRAPDAGVGPSEREARRVLGVDREADQAAVKRAYRDRVKEVHPDAESGSEEAFRRVQDAYERLTD